MPMTPADGHLRASRALVKHGHACVELRSGDARLLVDPGTLGQVPDPAPMSAVLVTHGHYDHADTAVLEAAVRAGVPVFGPEDLVEQCPSEVLAGGLTVLRPGDAVTVGGLAVEVVGGRHARVHPEIEGPVNLAFRLGGTVVVTGDQHPDLGRDVPVLVTPVDAPWLRAVDLMEFVRRCRPGLVVGVHDGLLNETGLMVADQVLASLTREGAHTAVRPALGEVVDLSTS